MNIFQRLVLVAGAVALSFVIWTTPKEIIMDGVPYNYAVVMKFSDEAARQREAPYPVRMDVGAAGMRAVTILGVSTLLCFALKSREKK